MKENYSIEDLIIQMDGMAVYKVKGKDGLAYALTVLTYTEEIICRLDQEKFEKGLRDLLSLSHRSLTKVTEGGVDERDQQVWVTHRWNGGRPLEDIVNRRAVEAEETLKLKQDADSMIAKLGDRADALSFNPHFIFLGRTSEGELLTKYVIDYWQWFRDWALGAPFGGGRDAAREMGKLLKSLDGGARTPVSRPAAPAPQTKGPMIVLPGESFEGSPAPVPAPVEEAPTYTPSAPSPPKTRKLVTGYSAQAQVPAPVPTPHATPAAAPVPKTRRLVTAAPAPVAAQAQPAPARATVPTMLVTTSVPAHHEPAAPAPSASRAMVTQAPVRAPLSAPRTKTGTTLDSSGSGGGNATMIILGLILALTTIVGVMVINKKKDPSVASAPKEEKRDERLGLVLDEPKPEPIRPRRSKPVVAKSEPVEPVLMPKPEPRPFVPITPEKVEPRPAESAPVEPAPEPRPVVKKLPEVSPDIRPDVSQITKLAAGDTAGLASKVNTWVSVKGEVVTTSVDGDWAFTGEEPLVAHLRDGQLAVVKNKFVEVLGWLADERTLVVAEDYDISYPEPGAEVPVDPEEEPAPDGEPAKVEEE